MAFLTIFTTPKPFTDPHISTIQRNAIRSWKQLGDDASIVMIGDEEGMSDNADELNVQHVLEVEQNSYGTPLISSLFNIARQKTDSQILAYVNADIILLPDFLDACRQVIHAKNEFLIIGQRWDLNITEEMTFPDGWQNNLLERCKGSGRLHPRGGSDYFIFPRNCFINIPGLVVGRAGWDNWMIYEARKQRWATIDATESITIIHQDHDYRHLPNNQPHYRLPESIENTRLAGGEKAIFTLMDVNLRLAEGKLHPAHYDWRKFWREVEIFPLIYLQSDFLWKIFHHLFNPALLFRKLKIRMKTLFKPEKNRSVSHQ